MIECRFRELLTSDKFRCHNQSCFDVIPSTIGSMACERCERLGYADRYCNDGWRPSGKSDVQVAQGPGAYFHALVKECTGQEISSGCNCAAHISEMNAQGWLWCVTNWRTILGWVNEEADKRRAQGTEVTVSKFKCLKALVGLRKKHEAKT